MASGGQATWSPRGRRISLMSLFLGWAAIHRLQVDAPLTSSARRWGSASAWITVSGFWWAAAMTGMGAVSMTLNPAPALMARALWIFVNTGTTGPDMALAGRWTTR